MTILVTFIDTSKIIRITSQIKCIATPMGVRFGHKYIKLRMLEPTIQRNKQIVMRTKQIQKNHSPELMMKYSFVSLLWTISTIWVIMWIIIATILMRLLWIIVAISVRMWIIIAPENCVVFCLENGQNCCYDLRDKYWQLMLQLFCENPGRFAIQHRVYIQVGYRINPAQLELRSTLFSENVFQVCCSETDTDS